MRVAFFLLPLLFCQFLTTLPGLFAAEFPDDAAGAEFTVKTGIGAGPAGIQAFLAVPELHFLALHASLPSRVIAAFHELTAPLFFLWQTYIYYTMMW